MIQNRSASQVEDNRNLFREGRITLFNAAVETAVQPFPLRNYSKNRKGRGERRE